LTNNPKRLQVPKEERMVITPEPRKIAFKQIYTGYRDLYGIQLLYAYLNWDPDIMVDYAVIYKGRNADNTGDLILFDVSPIHSDRCTPAYRYYKKINKTKEFFDYGIDEMTIMVPEKFYEYITEYLLLSLKKDDPNYWKKPEHAGEVCKNLLDLSLYYTKKEMIESF